MIYSKDRLISLPFEAAHGEQEEKATFLERKKMSNTKRSRPRTRFSFMDSLWAHTRDVPTGETFFAPVEVSHILGYGSEYEQQEFEETRREQHWGRWETCAKCKRMYRSGEDVGDFNNSLTFRGWVMYILAPLTIGTILVVLL